MCACGGSRPAIPIPIARAVKRVITNQPKTIRQQIQQAQQQRRVLNGDINKYRN